MTSLIDKIELLIKREKTTPDRKKKDDSTKSSSEILTELFGAFNAAPPKLDDISLKKSKKSKKKHKKDKKKRSRSNSGDCSDDSEYSRKRRKRKKSKSKKHSNDSRESSPELSLSSTPPKIKVDPDISKVKCENVKLEIKDEAIIKKELIEEKSRKVSIKTQDNINITVDSYDPNLIPMPEDTALDSNDLRLKLDTKKNDSTATESDKAKGKIQIKNLKFSAVFEETVKKAEEEARKKAEKLEEGEYTDSSSSSGKEDKRNSHFPKSSDPGGILKKQAAETKVSEDDKSNSKRSKHSESSHKSSKRGSSRSCKRSRSRSTSRRRHRSRSRSKRRSQSRSRSKRRSRSRHRSSGRRSRSPRPRPRHVDPRETLPRHRRRSRSPTGVKLADSEKKRLLEVARRNAINMLKNGAVPAGAAALPLHTRNQVMAAIQSGGKSVDELTDFCKHLSKKEALGELSSVSSNDDDSENEDTLAFHHPFLVKEKAPIVMNIRGGAPLPVKSSVLAIANKDELRLQFPVSSGSQHRETSTEWVPVSPKKDSNNQIAKLSQKSVKNTPAQVLAINAPPVTALQDKSAPLALPAPPEVIPVPAPSPPPYMKSFTMSTSLTSVPSLPALQAPLTLPGPQAYPPGKEPPKIDIRAIVSEKLLMIRKEQENKELVIGSSTGFGWSSKETRKLGQFTGSTGAQILTPRELASGTQAWAKKDQLTRAAPVEGGMGMHLLQKMGWTPGRGLGKEGTGALQPLLLEVKLDTRGLQAKEESGRGNKGVKIQRQARGRAGGVAPSPLVAGGKHPVSLLGEYCSKHKLGPPEYNLCFECGPDHKKNFLFKVKVAGVEYQPAVASANKKQAKADSAQLALQKLGIL